MPQARDALNIDFITRLIESVPQKTTELIVAQGGRVRDWNAGRVNTFPKTRTFSTAPLGCEQLHSKIPSQTIDHKPRAWSDPAGELALHEPGVPSLPGS
jgi:hypothetical protein